MSCACVCRKNKLEQFCGVSRNGIQSWVLFLNALASLLHCAMFVGLLIILLNLRAEDEDFGITKKLTQSITVWQRFDSSVSNKTCAQLDTCIGTANDGEFIIMTKSVNNGQLTLEYLVLSFSFLSFLFQGLRPFVGLRIKGIVKDYLQEVKERVNWLRWVEYSFSATCMILAISFVVDPNIEFSTVLMVSTSTWATQMCGLVTEFMLNYTNDLTTPAWVIHLAGWVLQIGVFASVFNSYFKSTEYAADDILAVEPPSFVSLIVYGEAILFGSFGLTAFLDILDRTLGINCCCRKNPAIGFELAYIGLSLSAKFFLSTIVAANLWISPES
jgi:hypothetical protein